MFLSAKVARRIIKPESRFSLLIIAEDWSRIQVTTILPHSERGQDQDQRLRVSRRQSFNWSSLPFLLRTLVWSRGQLVTAVK
jgi:hypothetical protein